MTESFDLLDPLNLVAGTVGGPGERIFFLQARDATDLVSLKLEKGQVQGLASGMAELLDKLEAPAESVPPTDLVEPVMAAWTVGGLGIGVDEEGERIVVVASELLDDDDEEDAEPAEARVHITYAQARGFVAHALLLVEYGRDFGRQNGHRPH